MIVISKLAAAGGRMSLLRSRHWSGIARDGLNSPFLAMTAVYLQASFTLQVNTMGPRFEDLIRVETYDFFYKDHRIRWRKDWSHGGLLLPTAVGMIQKTKPTQPDYD